MAAKLKFYDTENNMFKREYDIWVTYSQALKIVTSVSQHFKVPVNTVTFYRHECASATNYYEIRLNYNPSLLQVIHELAHLHNLHHYGNWHHNKQLLYTITAIITYCNIVLKIGTPECKYALKNIKITAKCESKPLRNLRSNKKRLGVKQSNILFNFNV